MNGKKERGTKEIINMRKILSISIILIMFISLCMPIMTFAAEELENNDSDFEYCSFDVNWANGTKELQTECNNKVSATFKLDLNTVPTGFEYMQMEVSSPSAKISITNPGNNVAGVSGNRLIFEDNVSAGTSITSTINFYFPRAEDFSTYEESVLVTLTGYYKDPSTGEYVEINIEKTLKASVTSGDIVNDYSMSLYIGTEKASKSDITNIYGNSTEGVYKYLGWKAGKASASYSMYINSDLYTQNATLDITINRTSPRNESPMESLETINFGGLEDVFGEPQRVENEDGSLTYKFSKGTNSDTFDKNNCFSIQRETYTISVSYTIPDTENNPTGALEESVTTDLYLSANLSANGWNVTKSKDGTTSKKVSKNENTSASNSVQILDIRKGEHSWAAVRYSTKEYSRSLTNEKIESLLNGENIDLGFTTSINYIIGSDTDEQTGYVNHAGAAITYLGDDKQVKSISVGNSMTLKSISGTGMILIENGQEHELSGEYVIDSGKSITSYQIKLEDFLRKRYNGYSVVYTLSGSKLKELGLSETEIKNILSIGQNAYASGNAWLRDGSTAIYYAVDSEANKKSYMELNIGDSNSNTNKYGQKEENIINLLMYKNNKVINDRDTTVKNVNPTIYVRYPDAFKYNIKDVKLSNNANGKIYIDSYYMENGYLVVNCIGTYTSDMGEVSISVEAERELIDANPSQTQTVQAWLFTENENYVSAVGTGINPEKSKGQYMSQSFTIEKSSGIFIRTGIYRNGVMNIPDGDSESSKTNPMKYNNNEVVTYRTKVSSNGDTLKNISIINRLPLQGNKNISGNLDLGSTINLTNLQNIKVYLNGSMQTSNYTILYSEDINANKDSEFTELTDSVDLSTVKTIKVSMNDSFTLSGSSELIVEYQMTMPELEANESNIAGAISAITYTKNDTAGSLESSAAYVTNGNPNGTISLIKSFEGTENGAPDGVSLKGIKFRFINVNTNVVLTSDGKDVFETNEEGRINISNVPEGTYRVVEESKFDNYKGIDYTEVTIENGKVYPEVIKAENKLKLGTLKVNKKWGDAEESQGSVTLKVERTDGIEFTATSVVSTETGVATFEGLPYGEYKITETSGVYGWHGKEVIVNLNDEVVEIDYENYITTGTLQILKTVPEKETVEGLTFKVTGKGDVKYTKKDGTEFESVIEKQIIVGQDNGEVTTEISADKKQVTITIPNLPVGSYRIEEINMPEVDTESGRITKYVNINRRVNVPNEQNKVTKVTIENKYKTGTLNINVTGTEGTDLESFKVKVSGISYYGTRYSEEIDVPSNGKITVKQLEIGKYKVEECNTEEKDGKIITTNPDGFEVTYNPENANTNGVEIQYSQISNVGIHNEYTGKGKVKIVKTLEGESDKSKAEGIQFRIKGRDLVGKEVDEIITIGKDGTGTSNEIPVGTYLLSEIEETVPEIYAVCEEQEITISSNNTSDDPLVLNIENKLATRKYSDGNRTCNRWIPTNSSYI